MTSTSRDQLQSIERRQLQILSKLNHLQDIVQDQKSSDSPALDQPSNAVSGTALKPLFRWGHSASPKGSSHLIIFGGYGGTASHARLNDVLELSLKEGAVRPLSTSGKTPAPMMSHTASTVAHRTIVIGGRRSPNCILDTVSVLDLETLNWTLPAVGGANFPARHRHAAAAVGSKVYVHGGLNGAEILGDLFVLGTSSWIWSVVRCQGKLPCARFSHSLVGVGSKLYLFGGRGRDNRVYGDLHVLYLETLVWSEAVAVEGIPPSPRYSHTMTAVGHYLLVIGGCPITTQGSDLACLDLDAMSWVRWPMSWPSERLLVRHTATTVGESLVVVGGGTACFAFGTTFSPSFIINLEPFLCHKKGSEKKSRAEVVQAEELPTEGCKAGKQEIAVGWVFKADRDKAKRAKDALKQLKWIDPSRKSRVIDHNSHVAFPVLEVAVPFLQKDPRLEQVAPTSTAVDVAALEELCSCGREVLELELPLASKPHSSPQHSLRKSVSPLLEQRGIALPLLDELPTRWERLGDMVVLPAGSLSSPVWSSLGDQLWRTVAISLGASRLARQAPIASTGTRDSQLQLLYGVDGWVQHRENGILYCFDALKCMFSSGNVSEKLRIAKMECRGATVVDLFAGIGYYVLPFLLKAGAEKVYACEWNPHAVVALKHNLAVNGVEARCEVIEGDNRIRAPQGVADVVSLGLLPSSEGSWGVAVRALKKEGGVLLVHENVKDTEEGVWRDSLLQSISTLAASLGRAWDVSLVHFERVKWYAPHIRHVVADVCCKEVHGDTHVGPVQGEGT